MKTNYFNRLREEAETEEGISDAVGREGVSDAARPSSESVYSDILEKIIKLQYAPGEMISENQMAKEYGVSRTVIRSAFARLEEAGFVEVYAKKGTYVSRMNLHYIADLLMLRTAVEKEIISELYQKLDQKKRQELIERLEENLEKQEKFRNSSGYLKAYQALDQEFHYLMIQSVGRESLMQLLDQNMLHIARWRNFDVVFDQRVPELIDEHRRILEDLKRDTSEYAEHSIAAHLETITKIAKRAIHSYPLYFTDTEFS